MSTSERYLGLALALVATAIVLALTKKKPSPSRFPYPPGPKGYPIIGNLLDFPRDLVWEGLAKMAEEYNTDTLHLELMGTHLFILSNSDVGKDLAGRRSDIYVDKPQFTMVKELIGFSWSFSLMSYGSTWRIHRKLFHRFFNISVADQFDDKIDKGVNVFLRRLSESPERFLKHAHFLTGSLMLSVAYGLNVESEEDKYYSASVEAMDAVRAAIASNFFVDVFPILKRVPEWFPGAGFKRSARMAKEGIDKSITLPLEHVKEAFQAGTITTPSFAATCLEEFSDLSKGGVDEEAIRGVGGTIYLGGEETTAASLKTFFLAATLHPEVVRSAQRELDEVTGGDRLPEFSDKPQLPYISAIVKEVLRWRPPAPMAAPHRTTEDDVYKGQFIPARSIFMDNVWAMFHNESDYPNPDAFNPDRFLKEGKIDPSVKDPELQQFGWGRRICPGRHFALRVLFLTIARTLATFDISMFLDEDGNPIVPDGKYAFGSMLHPLPFDSDIKPRSAHALSLITEQ